MPKARTLRNDPLFWAMIAVHGVLWVLYLLPDSIVSSLLSAYENYGVVLMVGLGMLAPWIGLPKVEDRRERLFWMCWSGGFGSVLVIRLLYLVTPDLEQYDSGALGEDFLYVVFYLLLILSVQLKPDRPVADTEKGPVNSLEVAGTAVFVFVLLMYFIAVPFLLTPLDYYTWLPSLALYCSLDCFIVLFLLFLRQTTVSARWRVLYTWLVLAALCWVITDFLEVLYYGDLLIRESYGPLVDSLWYMPWLLVGIAGRVRERPVPEIMTRGGRKKPFPPPGRVSSAGWLVVAALALPVIHFGVDAAGFLDPDTRFIRDLLVLSSLLALLAMAWVHQQSLENRATALAWEREEAEARRCLLAAVVEQAPDIILIANADARVWYANRALSSSGKAPAEVLGYPLESVLAYAQPNPGRASLAEALQDGTGWEGKGKVPGKKGLMREEFITVAPVRDESGKVTNFVAVRHDTTHQARLERQTRQSQRMKSLARLAGGLSLHFNNALSTIHGHAEILERGFGEDAPEREDTRAILGAVERSRALVDRILIFSQADEEERSLVSVGAVVQDTLSLLRPGLPQGIQVEDQVQEGVGDILADRRQIHEVIFNLGVHAIRAMAESGGTLRVWVDRVSIGTQRAAALGLELVGDYVHVAVRDSGPGMDAEAVERVFDPFFIDDDLHAEGALGLPMVHGAVEANEGAITVESQPGGGTLFQLYFPAAKTSTGEADPRA